jgi:hypothetical protein
MAGTRTVALLALPFITVLSCGFAKRAAEPASPAESAAAASGGQTADKTKASGPKAAPLRKIIRNGELHVVVKRYDPARRAIEDLVQQAGGYVSSSQVNHSLGQVSSATLVLRVPSGKFDSLRERIAGLGTLERESTSSQDITEDYFDLKARLDNARKLEGRLLEIMAKQAGKLADLLAVERELARVREEIERFEGKLRLFDNLVDLSTLTVQLSVQERYVPPRAPSLGEDARDVLRGSWEALRGFFRGLLLAAVALLPWLIPIGAATYGLILLVRRWRRARAAKRSALSKPQ